MNTGRGVLAIWAIKFGFVSGLQCKLFPFSYQNTKRALIIGKTTKPPSELQEIRMYHDLNNCSDVLRISIHLSQHVTCFTVSSSNSFCAYILTAESKSEWQHLSEVQFKYDSEVHVYLVQAATASPCEKCRELLMWKDVVASLIHKHL